MNPNPSKMKALRLELKAVNLRLEAYKTTDPAVREQLLAESRHTSLLRKEILSRYRLGRVPISPDDLLHSLEDVIHYIDIQHPSAPVLNQDGVPVRDLAGYALAKRRILLAKEYIACHPPGEPKHCAERKECSAVRAHSKCCVSGCPLS